MTGFPAPEYNGEPVEVEYTENKYPSRLQGKIAASSMNYTSVKGREHSGFPILHQKLRMP
ncbi:hypothetical protein TESG_08406 [Trichophyton tonsurans CBS 112818]|uniref:Uncharacterized protein n=2 Tax=Trichophyton TaxID=5550 RepID=F2Q4W3_TRIEC|nr:hypothetical protein TESG_08406 [Trichophyton tonsurans CBS 112818]EGE09181.1 hypothetical protein TEQG_08827 [Trichophyton equinum CBS 127.97]